MFRFNPDGWDAWHEAVLRHQRGDGEALATMLAKLPTPVPEHARLYLAEVARRSATRKRGAQPEDLQALGRRVYRNRRIVAGFHAQRDAGETVDEAREAVAAEHGVSASTVRDLTRKAPEGEEGEAEAIE